LAVAVAKFALSAELKRARASWTGEDVTKQILLVREDDCLRLMR